LPATILISVKKTIWIIALLVLTFAGDRLGGWILKKQVHKSQFRYSRLYTDRAQSDILLVGNSRGLIFYEPYIEKITGKKTFNLSYNGMSVDLMTVLVKDYFEKYPAPKQMIVEVTMCDRINDQLTVGFNTYSPYSNNLEELILERGGNMGYGAKVSHLFRYNSEIFQRALYYVNKTDKDWLLDRVINQNMIAGIANQKPYKIDLEPDTLNRTYLPSKLKEMVAAAQNKGTEVHLVMNPYYPPFAEKITNIVSFKSAIESVTGLKVHDYTTAVQEVKAFGDYQHLNKYGAELYLDKLKLDGVLE
jgi:hypothetical protein